MNIVNYTERHATSIETLVRDVQRPLQKNHLLSYIYLLAYGEMMFLYQVQPVQRVQHVDNIHRITAS